MHHSTDEDGCRVLSQKEIDFIDAIREPDRFYAGLAPSKKVAFKLWEATTDAKLFGFVFSDFLVGKPAQKFKITTLPGEKHFTFLLT